MIRINRSLRSLMMALAALLIMMLAAVPVSAESTEISGSCHFNGSSIESSFSKDEFARAVSDLQPGDDVTFRVTYTNDYKEATDWYMENTVEQTLEKTTAAKKVAGTGKAEGGGYTYELIHIDKDGKSDTLFSSMNVGGDKKASNMEGLEQATNALDDWFFIETLGQNETGTLELHVAFDGETEVNDYMDTDGGLNVRFAVEIRDTPDDNPPGDNPPDGNPPGDNPPKDNPPRIRTGDPSNIMMWAGISVTAGLVLMILFVLTRRKEKDEAYDDQTGDRA